MPTEDFTLLYDQYERIIGLMPETFTSHQFILKLAQANQREYIEALYAYKNSKHRGGNAPFRVVHQILAQKLRAFPKRVKYIGTENSTDIFGNSNTASRWRKLE